MNITTAIIQLIIGAVAVPTGCVMLVVLGDRVLGRLSHRTSGRLRPWVWLAPALVLIGVILVYPTIDTIILGFRGASGNGWVGLANYFWAFSAAIRPVLLNNLLWLVVLPLATLMLGLTVAVLADRVRYERTVRTIVLLPAAISFVVAGITWQLMYDYQPPGQPQTGTVNAIWTQLPGTSPVSWITSHPINNFALIFVAVWMTLGTTTLILSAAVKEIPGDLLEAARIDGASEWQIFRTITVPSLWPSILVVITTQMIFALKVFDVVYVMTNGSYDTDVIANRLYSELFVARNFGHASALAVILLVVASPIVILNIRHFREERAAI